MRRVYTVRALRPLISGGALAAFVLVVALWGIGREVWVARVFNNMPHSADIVALGQFWVYAFVHTHVIVQILVLMVAVATVYLARVTARLIASFLIPVHA